MNDIMRAAAKVVAIAQTTVSEASRSPLDADAHIPEPVFDLLTDAVNDYGNEVAKAYPPHITSEQGWWDWLDSEHFGASNHG